MAGEETIAERRFTQRVRLAGVRHEKGREANYFTGLAMRGAGMDGGFDN
jgi:hypothetical protein